MILTACQKQLDSLFKDNMLDVSSDIDVLEQMMKRDGFADAGNERAPQIDFNSRSAASGSNARTAAAAQMGSRPHPTLNPNLDDVDIYPHYSTKQARNDD